MLLLRAGAVVLSGLLAWYGAQAPSWTELLWLCHVSTALLIAGIALERAPLASLAAVAYLGMGIPGWLIDLALVRSTSPQSALLHTLTPLFAVLAVRKLGYRADSWKRAWLLCAALMAVCRLFTPRELNLNAAYHAYPPLEGLLTEWWSTWPVYFAFAAAFLYCGHLLVQRLTRRLPAQGQREGQRGSPA